jgi:hypothetical protein
MKKDCPPHPTINPYLASPTVGEEKKEGVVRSELRSICSPFSLLLKNVKRKGFNLFCTFIPL